MDSTPTSHSWLHVLQVLGLVRYGNVDSEDQLTVLVAYNKMFSSPFSKPVGYQEI
jgi:hypothetical protein